MGKAKEISALWSQIKPQIGELVRLFHEVESHYEVTADAYQRGYEAGLNDAWEAARKIWEYDLTTLKEICGKGIMRMDWFMKFTASEAIEKIRAYEQEKEEQIQVGDEVEAMAGNAVVIEVIDGGQTVRYMYPDTITGRNKACNVTRTGRHFPEIAEVLAKMKESE